MFHDGGATMWLALLCSLIGNPLALVAIVGAFVSKKRGWRLGLGGAALVFGVLTLMVGAAGYSYGMSQAEQAVLFAEPETRAALLAMGRHQALNNVWFGLCGALLPLVFGSIAIVRGALTK